MSFRVALFIGLIAVRPIVAQTPESVTDWQTKFRAERALAVKQKFAPERLEAADKAAARGDTALAAGQLRNALTAYREARWLLPVLPAHAPLHIAGVLGAARLRHADIITAMSFSPDGKRLATASKDGSVKVWRVPPASQENQEPVPQRCAAGRDCCWQETVLLLESDLSRAELTPLSGRVQVQHSGID